MIPVVAQFLIGFIVIIISFAAGLNVLYGSVSPMWSGGNEYMDSAINAFTGLDNQVQNNVFQPYVAYWLGDITLFIYLIICGIVLVNMLIAMMGSKFADLTQKHLLLRKQHFYKGAALIELEHSIFPAPFNLPHLIFLFLTKPWWPYGEYDRWIYLMQPNPFIFTGQLRDMWCKYLDWLDRDKDEDEEQPEEEDDEDYFKEKDQYDANADEDELNAYVSKLVAIKPFIDMYFSRWQTRYREALATHRRNVMARGADDSNDDDDDQGKKEKEKGIESPQKKKSPKVVKAKKKSKDDDDDEKDPDYVAMQDKS